MNYKGVKMENYSEEWETPEYIVDIVRKTLSDPSGSYIGEIDLDACCSWNGVNCKGDYGWTKNNGLIDMTLGIKKVENKNEDGLTGEWFGNVWCNPPYGSKNIEKWFKKAIKEIKENKKVETVVMLLPNNIDAAVWHGHEGLFNLSKIIVFIKGRVSFISGEKREYKKQNTRGSILLYFGNTYYVNSNPLILLGHVIDKRYIH
jgi:hypothetical protein